MSLLTTTNLSLYYKYAQGGVYALINDSDKKVDIRYCSSLSMAIGAFLSRINAGYDLPSVLIQDKDKLQLVVLEIMDDPTSRLIHHGYWTDKYKSMGYSLYREHPALHYKVRIAIEDYLIYVKLMNRNYDSIIVGVFDNMEEAESFVSTCYSDEIKYPVYATNDLSVTYFTSPLTDR